MNTPVRVPGLLAAAALGLAIAGGSIGCSATSVYKKAAKIGIELVGDAVAENETQAESREILGRGPREADARYGTPRGVFVDLESGRDVRIYNVAGDLLGSKRWVLETEGGRVVALSQAQENPDLPTDQAKALLLEELLHGKTPDEVRSMPVADKLLFESRPRNLRRRPSGELVQVFNVTSFTDVTGSRFLVLGYDGGGRCTSVRYIGTP